MRILALDYGERRIGMAISDEMGQIAWPLKNFTFKQKNNFGEFWKELDQLANRYQRQIEILVGNPLSTHHDPSRLQIKVECFVNFLKNKKEFLVRLYDERYTTIMANDRLKVLQISARKRREIIDSLAATIMLQEYLDFHYSNTVQTK